MQRVRHRIAVLGMWTQYSSCPVQRFPCSCGVHDPLAPRVFSYSTHQPKCSQEQVSGHSSSIKAATRSRHVVHSAPLTQTAALQLHVGAWSCSSPHRRLPLRRCISCGTATARSVWLAPSPGRMYSCRVGLRVYSGCHMARVVARRMVAGHQCLKHLLQHAVRLLSPISLAVSTCRGRPRLLLPDA